MTVVSFAKRVAALEERRGDGLVSREKLIHQAVVHDAVDMFTKEEVAAFAREAFSKTAPFEGPYSERFFEAVDKLEREDMARFEALSNEQLEVLIWGRPLSNQGRALRAEMRNGKELFPPHTIVEVLEHAAAQENRQ